MGKKITEVRNKSKEGGESFKKGAEQGRNCQLVFQRSRCSEKLRWAKNERSKVPPQMG